jgi:hypothetical protein
LLFYNILFFSFNVKFHFYSRSIRATTRSRKDGRVTNNDGWESNRSGSSSKESDRDQDRNRNDGYGRKEDEDGDRSDRDGRYGNGRESKDGVESKDGGTGRRSDQNEYDDLRQKAFGRGVAIRKRTIPISFRSAHHGHTVALLQVHVKPRPFVVHRTFRFHQSENEFLKRRILITPHGQIKGQHPYVQQPSRIGLNSNDPMSTAPPTLPAKFIHCPANDVVVEWRDQKGKYNSNSERESVQSRIWKSTCRFFNFLLPPFLQI